MDRGVGFPQAQLARSSGHSNDRDEHHVDHDTCKHGVAMLVSPANAERPTVRCVHPRVASLQAADASSNTTAELLVDDVTDWYGVERPHLPGRPWTALNMVTSIDGSAAIDGASGGLGNATDRRVLAALRNAADIIVVGAGTARREGYRQPRKVGQRIAVVTKSGRLDASSDLFASGAGLAVTTTRASVPTGIEVLRSGVDEVDLVGALAQLAAILPAGAWAIVEGGPSLNGSLLSLDLIDEVNITTAPMLVGGAGQRMSSGATERLRQFDLVHQLIDSEQYVFSRWVRRDRADRRLS